MNYSFRVYNLSFDSVFEPPGGQFSFQGNPTQDVVISTGNVEVHLQNPSITTDFFQVSPREFLLTVRNVARYHVINGQEIVVDPFPDADIDKIRLFLFGSAIGALLYQRGLFPLHGSAISTEQGVMIFVGPQGIGKSTLAAHFQRRGYYLLSDDVCAITKDADGLHHVLPAFPQLRLCTDAFERLGNTADNAPAARFDVDKYVVPLTQFHRPAIFPLKAIYQLTDHDMLEIIQRPLQGFDRLNLLIANLYRLSYLPGFETKGQIMQLAASIAKKTAVYEIIRPRDTSRIEELIDSLEKQWCTNK